MTAKELIDRLSEFPPDREVLFDDDVGTLIVVQSVGKDSFCQKECVALYAWTKN